MTGIHWGRVDDRILYKNEDRYHTNWQERCDACLAPCCFFLLMPGYVYDYNTTQEEIKKALTHFVDEFVTTAVFEGTDWEDTRLKICPLNVDSQCIIYEDRPQLCKMYKCLMKCKLQFNFD